MTNETEDGTKEERQRIANMMGVPLDQIHRFDIIPEGNLTEIPDKKHVEFWGLEDDEHLTYTTVDEVVDNYLDIQDGQPLPEKITVVGYARAEVNIENTDVLERFLEGLDEDYGNPDGEYTTPTPNMREAEKVFLEAVKKEYEPWLCTPIEKKEIVLQEWIDAHKDSWGEGYIVNGYIMRKKEEEE